MIFCSKCGAHNQRNSKFCNKCGNLLKKPFVENVKINKEKNFDFILYITSGVLTIFIVAICYLLFISILSDNILFVEEPTNTTVNNEEKDNIDDDKIVTNSNSKNKYVTSIKTDNEYYNVSINTSNDVYKIIKKDSEDQKTLCPNEIIDIENRIIKNYNTPAINLCEMDIDFALELENVIKIIYNDFPTARGYLTNVTLKNVPASQGYIAAYQPFHLFAYDSSTEYYGNKTQILLNSVYYLNYNRIKQTVNSSGNVGYFPKNSNAASPLAHEYGHNLSFLAMINYYNVNEIIIVDNSNMLTVYDIMAVFKDGTFSLMLIEEAYNNYKAKSNTSMTLLEFRSSISKYAVSKDLDGNYIYDETIAEAFHDYYLNGNNAVDASKEIVEVLKKYLGGI